MMDYFNFNALKLSLFITICSSESPLCLLMTGRSAVKCQGSRPTTVDVSALSDHPLLSKLGDVGVVVGSSL